MKMKQLILLIAALFMTCAAMAQRPLVTLSHNGELSFFDSITAFQEAVDSATYGDIIYLSEGDFVVTENFRHNKSISVIGSGYSSRILGDIQIWEYTEDALPDGMPLFDGVSIEGCLSFDDGVSNINNISIKNCKIREFRSRGAGKNLLVQRCLINKYVPTSGNTIVFENSKIKNFEYNSNNSTYIHCNLNYPSNQSLSSNTFISCIIDSDGILHCEGNGAISQCKILDSIIPNNYTSNESSYIENCISDYEYGSILTDDLELGYDRTAIGSDGTVIGVYGGEIPYSESPSMPTVDSANSTVTFDKETNKLKVDIKVSTK